MKKFLLLGFALSFSLISSAQQPQDNLSQELTQLAKNSSLPGFAVAIVNENGLLYQEGFGFRLDPGSVTSLSNVGTRRLDEFRGQRVWAVAGIGNPDRFYQLLRAAGLEVDEVEVPDHGVCELGALQQQRSQPVIMTQKDAVKYRNETLSDIWYIPVSVRFDEADAKELLRIIMQKADLK